MVVFRACCLLLFISFNTSAQVNRYIVVFRDKTGTPYSVGNPQQFLSPAAVQRRIRQGIGVTPDDLPVNPAYVNQVKAAGAKTYFTSRWLNAVLTEMRTDTVSRVASLSCVASIELVAPGNKFSAGRVSRSKNKFSLQDAALTLPQLQQLEMEVMHKDGFHGEGIAIAVMDGGFPGVNTTEPFQPLFQRNGVKQTFNFVTNSSNVYVNCTGCGHGTEVLSVIAANSDDFTGGAWGADFYLFVTEDVPTEYRVEEYNWLFAAEKADSAGVAVISTSLGYNQFDDSSMDYTLQQMDGKTTVIARAATFALARGIVVVCSAGNEGTTAWHGIVSPANAAGVIACGAVTTGGEIAPFSSVGPSADGRIKPDVVALGAGAIVIIPSGAVGADSGTSFASPLVASLAAGVLQAYPFMTSGQVYDAIIRSADRASDPDNIYGYGVPRFTKIRQYVETHNVLSVYPNPYDASVVKNAGDLDKIRIDFNYDVGATVVDFYDIFGRQLEAGTVIITGNVNYITCNVGGLSSGVYLIKVRNDYIAKTIRFIKN